MSNRINAAMWLTAVFIIGPVSAFGQGTGFGMGGHIWPTNQAEAVYTGLVMVDGTGQTPVYYLDTDSDGNSDYFLQFGPMWYTSTSGVDWPVEGQSVTIEGVVMPGQPLPVLMVFKLDGALWRMSNEYGMFGWNMESVWEQRGDLVTVSGTVLYDDTYYYNHYYLDTDDDGLPDYMLGLGPMWYVPPSGLEPPSDGNSVEIRGWITGVVGLPMLHAVEIDGQEWRPETGPAPWAGAWMMSEHSEDAVAYCATDSASQIIFPSGHTSGMMGGTMGGRSWPDSTFVQFWNVPPDSMPGGPMDDTFMGFYVNVSDPLGGGMMNGMWGGDAGMIRFDVAHTIQMHYTDEDLADHGISEDDIRVNWWDSRNATWREMTEAHTDKSANFVSFSTTDLVNYYVLGSTATITANADETIQPRNYTLNQNYPNPFNPSTIIEYGLPAIQRVRISVFDLLGRRVSVLVDEVQGAGMHRIVFNALSLPSGVYLYRMDSGTFTATRQFSLIR